MHVLVNSIFNLLHLNISMHILHTVLHIFLKLPTGRICLTIQGFFIYSAPQGFIWNQHNNQHPVGLLAQLVECCTGITRSWVLISYRPEFFFQALFSLSLKYCSLLWVSFPYSFLYPQFTYMIFTYSQSLKSFFSWWLFVLNLVNLLCDSGVII